MKVNQPNPKPFTPPQIRNLKGQEPPVQRDYAALREQADGMKDDLSQISKERWQLGGKVAAKAVGALAVSFAAGAGAATASLVATQVGIGVGGAAAVAGVAMLAFGKKGGAVQLAGLSLLSGSLAGAAPQFAGVGASVAIAGSFILGTMNGVHFSRDLLKPYEDVEKMGQLKQDANLQKTKLGLIETILANQPKNNP